MPLLPLPDSTCAVAVTLIPTIIALGCGGTVYVAIVVASGEVSKDDISLLRRTRTPAAAERR